MPYRFLDHTADLAVELRSATLDELFGVALEAFTACLLDPTTVEERERRPVMLQARDGERLLVRWLEEALVAFELDGFLARRAEVATEPGEPLRLRGVLIGERLDPDRHHLKVLIKGISYHDLSIQQRGAEWRATLVLDI